MEAHCEQGSITIAKNRAEHSLFTKRRTRLMIREDETHVQITADIAQTMAEDGWRWSGHTHCETDKMSTIPSDGDLLILKAFGQKQSAIYNAYGKWDIFEV